jgi:REP element-mobilizing transposase RayT
MRPPRTHQGQDGTLFFVTTVTRDRIPYFSHPEAAKTAEEMILWYKQRGDYWLGEYVIMPDHLHLLICPNSKNLSQCMHNLKRTISEKIGSEISLSIVGQERSCPTIDKEISTASKKSGIWQSSFYDSIIHSEHERESVRHYILDNPVKAGLSPNAVSYIFSSANKQTDRHRIAAGCIYPCQGMPLLIGTTNKGKVIEIQESLKGLDLEILSPLDLYYEEVEKRYIPVIRRYLQRLLPIARGEIRDGSYYPSTSGAINHLQSVLDTARDAGVSEHDAAYVNIVDCITQLQKIK